MRPSAAAGMRLRETDEVGPAYLGNARPRRFAGTGAPITARGWLAFLAGIVFVLTIATSMELASAAGVWECDEADQTTNLDPVTGNYEAQCVGTGNWVEHNPEFDPSTLDPAVVASALAGGFVTMGFGCLLALGVRTIVNAVKSS